MDRTDIMMDITDNIHFQSTPLTRHDGREAIPVVILLCRADLMIPCKSSFQLLGMQKSAQIRYGSCRWDGSKDLRTPVVAKSR